MKILLITDSYPPEIRSAAHLMLELAQELHKRGHQVTVATTWPQYNLADNAKNTLFTELMNEQGIKVLRIKVLPHHNTNYVMRAISQLTQPWIFLKKLKQYALDNVDAVIVYSPPLPLGLIGGAIKKRSKATFFLNVQDLFPQNAIDLGILRHSLLIKFFRQLEKKIYTAADIISAHSEGNRKSIIAHYPQLTDKIVTLHNWVDAAHHQKDPTVEHKLSEQYGLTNKFVAIFAGVIGPSQHVDFIINMAAKVTDLKDVVFLLVGDGAEKKKLIDKVTELQLSNVIFKPFVGRNEYPALLDICSIGLVCLSPKNKTPVVPGKILGYMAAGLPVFACLNRESDGHEIIQAAKCGYSVESDDLEHAITAFRSCYQQYCEQGERLTSLGRAGQEYVTANFTKEHCVSDIESLLKKRDLA